MILNPIKCKKCGRGLQPENIGVGNDSEGNLIRICLFCGDEIVIKLEEEDGR